MALPSIVFPASLPPLLKDPHVLVDESIHDDLAMALGHSRTRRIFTSTPIIIEGGWSFNQQQAAEFFDFYENTLEAGTHEFQLEVEDFGPGLTTFSARFLDCTEQARTGGRFEVRAILVLYPDEYVASAIPANSNLHGDYGGGPPLPFDTFAFPPRLEAFGRAIAQFVGAFAVSQAFNIAGIGTGSFVGTGLLEGALSAAGVGTMAAVGGVVVDDDILLWLPFDGTNGSSTITDLSPYARSPDINRNVTLSTTAPKFGSAAAPITQDTGLRYADTASRSFKLENGVPFTIHFWWKANSVSGGSRNYEFFNMASGDGTTTYNYGMDITSTSLWRVKESGEAVDTSLSSTNHFITGVWYHLAWTYDGTTHYLFRNGEIVANPTPTFGTASGSGMYLHVGCQDCDAGSAADSMDGRLDDFVFINGQCLWDDYFIPPLTAFAGLPVLEVDWTDRSATGGLDSFQADMQAAFGFKCLFSDYQGPLVRVHRSSDLAEADIGYVNGTGVLDTSALSAFVGSDSAFVSVWYDQSGNQRHWMEANPTHRPRIVNAGTYQAYLLGEDGTSTFGLRTPRVTVPTITRSYCWYGKGSNSMPESSNFMVDEAGGTGEIVTWSTDFGSSRMAVHIAGQTIVTNSTNGDTATTREGRALLIDTSQTLLADKVVYRHGGATAVHGYTSGSLATNDDMGGGNLVLANYAGGVMLGTSNSISPAVGTKYELEGFALLGVRLSNADGDTVSAALSV